VIADVICSITIPANLEFTFCPLESQPKEFGMFGKSVVKGSDVGSAKIVGLDNAQELCFRLDLTKAYKALMGGFGFLAVGGWLFNEELLYWNEGVYSQKFFLACGCLLFAPLILWISMRDLLRRDRIFLRVTPTGLKALGWADELRWSEIADFSICTQRVNGVNASRILYAVSSSLVMKRICPSLWQRVARVRSISSAQPALHIPVERISGDVNSVGALMYEFWRKYK
jgi:hypothetical protein